MSRTWIRSPKIISAFVFLVLIAIVWFGGPYMGIPKVETRFGIIFVLMFLWVVTLMIGKFIADRSSSVFEKVLRRKTDEALIGASPEKRAEVALLRQRLLSAIDTLKQSKLGKTRGKAALYELPWYLVIGHPSAGKSSAIQNSGLSFPLAGKGPIAIQGVGGTRNCDWFFSTEGVLLDTAGRYSIQQEDRVEWLEFVKLLRKHRPQAPVNGVLVTLSFSELINHRSDTFLHYARQVRQRINELESIFKTKVPVYLVFTKMDLQPGFVEFFEHLTEEERRQAWGASLPHDQGPGFDTARAVARHMDALVAGLVQMGQDRLAAHRSLSGQTVLHAFPLEFRELKEAVCRFIEFLVEKDPYHTQPLIRGFYFTSALQEGQAGLTLGNRVAAQFELDRGGILAQPPSASKSYFLLDFFHSVIFPDQFLIGRFASPRRSRARLVTLLSGLGGLMLLLGIWTWSFIGNQRLIAEAREEMVASRKLASSGDLIQRLTALQVLQLRLEQLYQYRQEGRPWRLSWGLYKGKVVERMMREEYFRQLRSLMLLPVKGQLEARLREDLERALVPSPQGAASLSTATAGEGPRGTEEARNTLKTYLMLNQRNRMEASHLTDQIPKFWRPWLAAQGGDPSRTDVQRLAERTIAFFASQTAEPDIPIIDNDEALVNALRLKIRGATQSLSPLERLYEEVKASANTEFAPLTVGKILESRDLDLVAGSHAVPGAFTREALDKKVRKALEDASKGQLKGTDWVLAAPLDEGILAKDADANLAKLEAMYRADYMKEWQRFLEGVAIKNFSNLDAAAAGIGRLAELKTSALKAILVRAARETAWDNPSELSKTLGNVKTSVVQRTERLLGQFGSSSNNTSQYGEVGGRFSVVANVVADQNGRMPLDGYLEVLRKVQTKLAMVGSQGEGAARQMVQATFAQSGSEIAEAQQYVDNVLLQSADETSKSMIRAILLRPLMQAFAPLLSEAEADLNRLWAVQVLRPWSVLADKYPFTNSGNEASLADIVKFLKPGEGPLDQYVDKVLGPMVARRGGQIAPRSWGSQGIRFSPAFLSSVSRLLQAAETVILESDACRFELQPVPVAQLNEINLEIDGQPIRYRMGPQYWTPLAWPGPGPQGARIQVISTNGASAQVVSANGRLGLLRILDEAKVDSYGTSASIEWRFRVNRSFLKAGSKDGGQEAFPQPIRFNFRLVSGMNPLKLSALRHHSLPSRVTP